MKKILLTLILLSAQVFAQEPQNPQQTQQAQEENMPTGELAMTAPDEFSSDINVEKLSKEKIDALLITVDNMRKQNISDEFIIKFLRNSIHKKNSDHSKIYITLGVVGIAAILLALYIFRNNIIKAMSDASNYTIPRGNHFEKLREYFLVNNLGMNYPDKKSLPDIPTTAYIQSMGLNVCVKGIPIDKLQETKGLEALLGL